MNRTAIYAATAIGLGLIVAPPAAADAVSGATLTWKVSECAFDASLPACTSLTQTQSVGAPTTKEAEGWRFTGGTGQYDPASGSTTVHFTGSLTLGNTSRGNYAITLANPQVTVAAGAGSLRADVSYRIGATEPTTVTDVKIVDLPAVAAGTSWQSTPPWDPATGQFAQELLDVLPDSLDSWFKVTGTTGANPSKPAAPVTVDLGAVTPPPAYTPTVTITGAENLSAGDAATITVKGSGFDPAQRGPAVQGLYVVFGPNAASVGYGLDKASVFGAAQFLPAAPDATGAFTTTLTIKGRYTDSDGRQWDGSKQALGVSTWAAHSRATTAWDTFTPISFRPSRVVPTLRLKATKVKAGKRAVARVAVDGKGRVSIMKRTKRLASAKVANGKAVIRLPKLKPGRHTLRAVYKGTKSAPVVLRVMR